MKLVRCDNCKSEDDACWKESFGGEHGTLKAHVLKDKGGFSFRVHLCGACIEKILDAFPAIREATELYF